VRSADAVAGDSPRASAVCVYSLRRIDAVFKENTRACNDGQGRRKGLEWYSKSNECQRTEFDDESQICGNEVNPLIGESSRLTGLQTCTQAAQLQSRRAHSLPPLKPSIRASLPLLHFSTLLCSWAPSTDE
jgi:hypothetical protein